MNERKEVTLTIRGYETVADILEGIRNAGFTIVSEHPVNPPDEALREALRAKIAEWRAAAKKWGDNYLISGSESSRIISRCLTERADEIESLLDAPEPPGSVAGDEYDAAAREWELKESCDGNEDDLKWLKDRVIRLAAHFRAACGNRESELEKALREARKFIRGKHSTLTYGPQSLLDRIDAVLQVGARAACRREK